MSTTKAQRKNSPQGAAPVATTRFNQEIRETVETVVFVLVLVSLLRMFGCEAFVIPTGSMATTLLGTHKSATCPQCGYTSTVNASDQDERGIPVTEGYCQNCLNKLELSRTKMSGGDRVLVSKFLYEGLADPDRWEVVVFKVPEANKWPKNTFIKRLIGKPGETIGVGGGDIHVRPPGAGPDEKLAIVRKPPQVMMAVRRLVYDNDLPAADLVRAKYPPQWADRTGKTWTPSVDGKAFTSDSTGNGWLTYHHILRGFPDEPQLITDFEAYNTGSMNPLAELNWVGDLMLDCNVEVAKDQGRFLLELGEGRRRYQAIFDLEKNRIALTQNGEELASKEWSLGEGSYHLRFANFDDRLTLWVDGDLVFGDGIDVDPLDLAESGPTSQDLEPARIGAESAAVTVSDLLLYRDIYYTQRAQIADARFFPQRMDNQSLANLRVDLGNRGLETFEVPADSYLMLGDNSPRSSDGREWRNKFVPRHLVLGRALILYWPVWNWKFVR